jgi:hypothetical protein
VTGDGPKLANPVVAVRLRGAHVVGWLNLGGRMLRWPLELNECHLLHRLDLAKAEAPNLSLRGSCPPLPTVCASDPARAWPDAVVTAFDELDANRQQVRAITAPQVSLRRSGVRSTACTCARCGTSTVRCEPAARR